MSLVHGPGIVTDGISLLFDAANLRSYSGSGTAWNDLSGNSNNGVLQLAPTFSSTNAGYFAFNGTSQYVSTTTQIPVPGPLNFSLCVWFQTSTASGNQIIQYESTQTGTGSANFDRDIYVGTDGLIYFHVFASGNRYATTPTSFANGQWNYVVATYTSASTGIMQLYMNGILLSTVNSVGTAQSYAGWWRLASYAGTGLTNASAGYFTGNIAVATIYNTILTQNQINQNYNAYRGRFGV